MDEYFLGLQELQHLLTDTLQPVLYIYCQIDNLLLTFSSAPLAFTVTFLPLALSHLLRKHITQRPIP